MLQNRYHASSMHFNAKYSLQSFHSIFALSVFSIKIKILILQRKSVFAKDDVFFEMSSVSIPKHLRKSQK